MSGKGVQGPPTADLGAVGKRRRWNPTPRDLGSFLSWSLAEWASGPILHRVGRQNLSTWMENKSANEGHSFISVCGACHRLTLNYVFVCPLFYYCLVLPEMTAPQNEEHVACVPCCVPSIQH